MKKQLFILASLFILTTGMTGCDKEEEGKETPNSLVGTKWKLVGFVDAETGDMIEAEPKDCEECYTITFDTDSTASGYSVSNIITVNLRTKPYIGVATEIYDDKIGNVSLFYETIKTLVSYKIEEIELRFYFHNNQKYLLFKNI